MNGTRQRFTDSFTAALQECCPGAEVARILGSEAARIGLQQEDLAAAYQQALTALFSQPTTADTAYQAGLFFMECLTAFHEASRSQTDVESAERYRQMFQKNQAVKLLIDPVDGSIVDANPAACEFYGYSLDVLKALRISDINTLSPEQLNAEMARAAKEQRVYFVFQHQLASGDIRDVEVYSGPIDLGGRRLLFSIIHDITERKQSQRLLQQTLENYQGLVSSIQGIVWEADASTFEFTFVSQRAEKLLGYPVEAWLGAPNFWVEHMHPDDQEWAPAFRMAETAHKRNHVFEYRMIAADGRIVWLQDIVSVILEHDQPVKLRGVMIDITERKWIEAELARSHEEIQQQVEKALRESENRYRMLFDSSADAIFVHEPNGLFLDANRAACERLGYTRDELLKLSPQAIDVPDYADQVTERVTDLPQHGFFETAHKRRDSTIIPVEVNAQLIDYDGKKVVLSAARDITERKRAEQALFFSQRELTIRNRVADIFLTTPDDLMYGKILQVILDVMESPLGLFGYINSDGDLVIPSLTSEIWDQCQMPDKTVIFPPTSWGGIWGEALRERRVVCANRTFEVPSGHIPITRAISVPIVHQQDLIGHLLVGNKPTDYTDQDAALMESVALHIAPVLHARLQRDREEYERKRAEEELNKLSSAIEQTADDIVITNREGVIEYVNPAFEALTGYSRAEVIGQTPRILQSGQHGTRFYETLWRTVLSGHAFRAIFVNQKKNGSLYYAEKTITPLRDAEGEITHFVSTGKDITERKQAEAELKARAMRQAAMAELSQLALFSTDPAPLMRRAISLVTQTLRFDFCAIWELVPETHQLHLQTGVGWPESMIGMPLLDTDERSQEGQTIRKREPVIISGREHQIDCANTQFIRQYGIESSVCVSIHGKGHPFGLFCGYNTQPRKFTLDEVHFLQVAADVLAQAVERQRADVAEHEQRALAEALRESAAALNSTLNLEKVLELILANIERVVPHHAAHIMLIEQDQAVVARHYGYAVYGLEEPLVSRPFSTLDHPHLRQMVETGQPLVIRDKSAYSSWWNDLSGTCLPSYVGAPIRREDETIGFLHLDSALPNFFTPIHAERLQAFADQAALAIANARLFEQSRNLAMMEERQRLARDLHDAVSQTLFSASVVAEALPRLWNRDSEAVQQGLEELHLLTRGALAEMRTLLLELRPTALIETRFDELLRHLTQAFSGKNRITVELGIIEGVPALPPNVQVALYRIVQEALNNIAKHARASHVAITLSQTDEQIILCVKDDGRGFDQSLRAPNRFGLQIMQERARGIEASYTIKSEPGHGTEITVQWPEDL